MILAMVPRNTCLYGLYSLRHSWIVQIDQILPIGCCFREDRSGFFQMVNSWPLTKYLKQLYKRKLKNYTLFKNKTKQSKTKQNKTKQNKTKQNKTKQNKTKQNKTKQNKNKTKQNKNKAKQNKNKR